MSFLHLFEGLFGLFTHYDIHLSIYFLYFLGRTTGMCRVCCTITSVMTQQLPMNPLRILLPSTLGNVSNSIGHKRLTLGCLCPYTETKRPRRLQFCSQMHILSVPMTHKPSSQQGGHQSHLRPWPSRIGFHGSCVPFQLRSLFASCTSLVGHREGSCHCCPGAVV